MVGFMKKTFKIISLILIFVIIAVSLNYIYVFYSRQKVSAYIQDIVIINEPQKTEDIVKVLNTTVKDNFDWQDNLSFKSLSDDEKNMTYNLDDYNVYRIDTVFVNKSNFNVSASIKDYCSVDKYMAVPTIFGYNATASGERETYSYYYFVSKDCSLDEIQDYLKNNGVNYNATFEKKHSGGSFNLNAKQQ